ncbi:uncharacterized protein SAPINGB_P006458 [Magnusiomyces paraingens]|uniref:RRM domain-containing protein n=1 Tax=Magnusiomyces paraingens TaxID=2606893 RepID=A0A5E8C7R8_9ASCO|nr:uncharacterized protein SAPINGB_P006458 [Saprochaete ingens]VVT58935.1 unnamed protein product [Saprochaete ingens]
MSKKTKDESLSDKSFSLEEKKVRKEKNKDKKEAKEKKDKKDKKEKKEKKDKKDKKRKHKEIEDEDHIKSDSENQDDDAKKEKELIIDLEKDAPLSKKQKRLQKKGKDVNSKISKKMRQKLESTSDLMDEEEADNKEQSESNTIQESKDGEKKKGRSDFGIWIGNLSYDTTTDDLKKFFIDGSSALNNSKEEDRDQETTTEKIVDRDITRIRMPMSKFKKNDNQGFAYIDFRTAGQLLAAIGLSENLLNGRKVLIKNAVSFEGRPSGATKGPASANPDLPNLAVGPGSDNPPTRILFVGNLSFDTTEETLEQFFQHCGQITKIRLATFEDSGKCKGFGFIDFINSDGPTTALKDKSLRRLNGRMIKMQYGEDRSKRTKQDKMMTRLKNQGGSEIQNGDNSATHIMEEKEHHQNTKSEWSSSKAVEKPKKTRFNDEKSSHRRIKPGLALATAQRGKVGIVESKGKKITFD